MNPVRILVPTGLAVVAGVLYFLSLSGTAPGIDLVIAREDIKPGTLLTDDLLDHVAVRADRNIIGKSAVPHEHRGVALLGRTAHREVKAGELLFFVDVQEATPGTGLSLRPGEVALLVSLDHAHYPANLVRPGNQVGFVLGSAETSPAPPFPGSTLAADLSQTWTAETSKPGGSLDTGGLVGPFRVVSVGDRTDPRELQSFGHSEEARLLSVAVKPNAEGELDGQTNRLVKALQKSANSSGERVVAMVLYGPGTEGKQGSR
jgi:hypothetical protein